MTPDVEVTEGFYNFSAAQLKAFSERFKGQESIDGLFKNYQYFCNFFLLVFFSKVCIWSVYAVNEGSVDGNTREKIIFQNVF